MLGEKKSTLRIAIGSDHRGIGLKQAITQTILTHHTASLEWHDVGCHNAEYADFPLYAPPVCHAIQEGICQLGILICGSGVGMSIAANRFPHIYAALVWNEETARLSKEHDNANVLVLPADFIAPDIALIAVRAWLGAEFKQGKYQARLELIEQEPHTR